jgi:hypothetical protein
MSSTLIIYFLAIGVVVYGLTAGTKWALPSVRHLGLGVFLRTLPVLFGLGLGAVPGLFPATVPYGLGVLVGGAAGVFCGWTYEMVSAAIEKQKATMTATITGAAAPKKEGE